MTKKKVKLCRRFNNCIEAGFDTVVNKYLFKGEAENLLVHLNKVSVVNSFSNNTVMYNSVGIKEVSANRVELYEKDISNVNCVEKKCTGDGFQWNVLAKTFFPGCEYTSPISGCPVPSNQYNIGFLLSNVIGDDIGVPSLCSINNVLSDTSIYWVGGDEPSFCTDELRSTLVHTGINSVAGSIPSDRSNTDLSIHDLEQLVYKAENQQGLWDISTCTKSNIGGLYYASKRSRNIVNNVSISSFLFNSSLKSRGYD